MHKHNHKQN